MCGGVHLEKLRAEQGSGADEIGLWPGRRDFAGGEGPMPSIIRLKPCL